MDFLFLSRILCDTMLLHMHSGIHSAFTYLDAFRLGFRVGYGYG